MNLVDWFLPLHILIAAAGAVWLEDDPFNFAAKALFPASSILIGASLAWSARATTILQNKEFAADIFAEERPAEDYEYGFQLSFLVIMLMVGYVAIMAAGGVQISVFDVRTDRLIAGWGLYFLLSLSIRECWSVVNFTNLLGLLDHKRPR